jgi:Bardet-Biedl syndrome 4 protein
LIHSLFLRKEFDRCLEIIERRMTACRGLCEFPIYVKALIMRRRGKISESLQLFQAATCLNPLNVLNLKQVARSLYLLGKHKASIEVYEESLKIGQEDWEIWHNVGLSYLYVKRYKKAQDCFRRANLISRHDETYLKLGHCLALEGRYEDAVDVYLEALEFSPASAEILTTLGLAYLRMGKNFKAFDFFGAALTADPTSAKAILAAGSVIQDNNDMAVALIKYRVAAAQTPHSAQLWNNVGMCFFGLHKYVAAVSCLKHALFLDPFEWIISYNLGLVHLNTGQHASAFHHLSTAINLQPDFASSYMYLAIALVSLEDFDNACSAFEKAIEMDQDHLFHLNYSIVLWNHDDKPRSRDHFLEFERVFMELDDHERTSDADVLRQQGVMRKLLKMGNAPDPRTVGTDLEAAAEQKRQRIEWEKKLTVVGAAPRDEGKNEGKNEGKTGSLPDV